MDSERGASSPQTVMCEVGCIRVQASLRVAAELYAQGTAAWCEDARAAAAGGGDAGGGGDADNLKKLLSQVPILRDFHKSRSATAAWLEPVLEYELVRRSADLLCAILDACQLISDRDAAWRQLRDLVGAAASRIANTCEVVVACAEMARTLSAPPALNGPAAAAAASPELQRLWWRLVEQLVDGGTVKAMARVPGFVQQRLWPLVLEDAGGGSADPGAAIAIEGAEPGRTPVPHGPDQPAGSVFKISGPGPASLGHNLVANAACLVASLTPTVAAAESLDAGAQDALGRDVAGRFLAALVETRFVASLSAALLAAPPRPEVAATPDLDCSTWTVMLAQRNVLCAIHELSRSSRPYIAPLLVPEVRQLQWELLEQVAATTATGVAGAAAGSAGGSGRRRAENPHAGASGSNGGGGGSSSRDGRGAKGRAEAPRRRWPLMQERCLQGAFGEAVLMEDLMYEVVGAAANPPFCLRADGDVSGALAYEKALFPSRPAAVALAARVCAALHARLRALGPTGPQPQAGSELAPPNLVTSGSLLQRMILFLMSGATSKEQAACLPDLLGMSAWVTDMTATPASLAHLAPERAHASVSKLAASLHAQFVTDSELPMAPAFLGATDSIRSVFWRELSPAVRATCVQQLMPTDLPRSLDRLMRWAAERGTVPPEGPGLVYTCIGELLGPLLRARLVRWLVQQQQQQNQQQEQKPQAQPRQQQKRERFIPGATAEADNEAENEAGNGRNLGLGSGSDGGGGGGGGSASSTPDGEQGPGSVGAWSAREELSVLLTALKLLRNRKAVDATADGQPPDLFTDHTPHFALACFVLQLGCSDGGLPSLLPELIKAVGTAADSGDPGGVAGASGPRPGDVSMVAQAVAACGLEGLRHLASLLEHAAEAVERGGLTQDSHVVSMALGALVAADSILGAVKHAPREVLIRAEPQRALVAVGRLVNLVEEWCRRQGDPVLAIFLGHKSFDKVVHAVLLLSADEGLNSRCVPGWVWAERGAGRPECELKVSALVSVRGRGVVPPRGPVVIIKGDGTAISRLGARRWADDGRHAAAVAALARAQAQELGLLERCAWQLATEACGGAGGALWPPRRLRLCGNPRCGNFSGASEAGLELKQCAGCRCVRYCGAACQRQHWPVHKEECRGWRAEVEAQAQGA